MAYNSQQPFIPPTQSQGSVVQPPYQHFISQQAPTGLVQSPQWTPSQTEQQSYQQNQSPSQTYHQSQVSPPGQQHFVSHSPVVNTLPSQHQVGGQQFGQPQSKTPPYQHFVSQKSQDASGPPPPQSAFDGEETGKLGTAQPEGPPQPSAPDPSLIDHVTGYEAVGFADSFIPPPTFQPAEPRSDGIAKPPTIPTISEDDARQALLSEVEKHCCYGKKAARELTFTSITPHNAFHYQLETYTEKRSTVWKQEPYSGQLIDGPQNGPAPGPWDIAAQPNQLFQDHEKHFEVPHTASVKGCHNCGSAGMVQCWRCTGRGKVLCGVCHGSGRRGDYYHHRRHHHHHHYGGYGDTVCCYQCDGTGYRRCWTCGGCGRIECSVCRGKCQLKWYIKLTVTWKTHKADHIVERTALPDHLIRDGEGKVVFKDQQPRVAFIQIFPEQDIIDASKQLVDNHARTFTSERILQQRHWVRSVPVSAVSCEFNEKPFRYFVYGYNTLVYAPEYPQKICCGCTIV